MRVNDADGVPDPVPERAGGDAASGSAPDLVRFARRNARSPRRRLRRRLVVGGMLVLGLAIAGGTMASRVDEGRLSANEAAAIAALKQISSAQAYLQATGAVDQDGNRQGEFGFLAELVGAAVLRGSTQKLDPPALSMAFATDREGRVELGGYLFEVFLPSRDGGWVSERTRGTGGRDVDPARAEHEWTCYAWPSDHGSTGKRAFMIANGFDIFATNMSAEVYSGSVAPMCGVAGHRRHDDRWTPAANTTDERGNRWVVI